MRILRFGAMKDRELRNHRTSMKSSEKGARNMEDQEPWSIVNEAREGERLMDGGAQGGVLMWPVVQAPGPTATGPGCTTGCRALPAAVLAPPYLHKHAVLGARHT